METNQTFEEAVLKTVIWWSDKSFRTPFNQNNGDGSEHGGLAFLLMNMLSNKSQENITDEKIKVFEEHLAKSLTVYRVQYPTSSIWLDVDYHPCQMLAEAAEAADLESQCFPCKSSTRLDANNKVFARYQYGGASNEI